MFSSNRLFLLRAGLLDETKLWALNSETLCYQHVATLQNPEGGRVFYSPPSDCGSVFAWWHDGRLTLGRIPALHPGGSKEVSLRTLCRSPFVLEEPHIANAMELHVSSDKKFVFVVTCMYHALQDTVHVWDTMQDSWSKVTIPQSCQGFVVPSPVDKILVLQRRYITREESFPFLEFFTYTDGIKRSECRLDGIFCRWSADGKTLLTWCTKFINIYNVSSDGSFHVVKRVPLDYPTSSWGSSFAYGPTTITGIAPPLCVTYDLRKESLSHFEAGFPIPSYVCMVNLQGSKDTTPDTPLHIEYTADQGTLYVVFKFLDTKTLMSAELVCKEWYHVAKSEAVWSAATCLESVAQSLTIPKRLSTRRYMHRRHKLLSETTFLLKWNGDTDCSLVPFPSPNK